MTTSAKQNPIDLVQQKKQRRSYLMTDFCRISFPIRNPGSTVSEWVRVNDNRTYVIHPQTINEPGKGITHIWPYGKKARLLLVWISTQVVQQKDYDTNRVIMLPSTLRQLMEDLGIKRKPRKTDYDDFRYQLRALSTFHMTINEIQTTKDVTWAGTDNITFAQESRIGWTRYQHNSSVMERYYIQLTQETWDRMSKSSSLSSDMIEILTRSGRGAEFDIYVWLSQCIYALNCSQTYQSSFITWKALQAQMGTNFTETRNFVTKFKLDLAHVAALWNNQLIDAGAEGQLNYSIEKGGLRLYSSPLIVVPKSIRPKCTDQVK